MTDRHATEQTSRARPPAAGAEPDLVVVVEYQRIELKRVLKENQNLRGDIDRLLRLLERDQVIRQQEQQDRGTMLAVMDRLAAERALPPPPPNTAAPEAAEADEATSDAPPPDLGEEAPENEFETSLSDLQDICDRLESVRARAPGEAANQTAEPAQSAAPAQPAAFAQPAEPANSAASARPAAPAESPDDMAALSENADLAALLRRLDQLAGTEEEIGPQSTTGFMTDAERPGSAEARARRVLARLAALFERRP